MKVVVIGAGLSGLAAAYRLQEAGFTVQVLEADNRPGGRCATLRRDGFVIDTGPEIVAGTYNHYLKLVRDVGLGDNVVPSSPVVGTVRDGRVIDNDTTKPLRMAFTPLLSWGAKIRLALGLRKVWPVVQQLDAYRMADWPELDDPAKNADERARELVGDEAAEYLIDPLVRMIGGAHPAKHSQLLMLGGLNSWSAALCNLKGGLDTLPQAVAARLDVRYGMRVTNVSDNGAGVTITCGDADGGTQTVTADRCLLACHIDDAARIAPDVARAGTGLIDRIPFAKLIDIKLAYRATTGSTAFACQVPSREDRALLMYSLTHNKAPDRAPAGHSLFTIYMADDVFDEFAPKSDAELIAWGREKMEALYPEVKGAFLFGHAGRYGRAGYRVDPGYFRRIAQFIGAIPADARIQVGGDVFGGGSMEAAVLWGERAAARIIAQKA